MSQDSIPSPRKGGPKETRMKKKSVHGEQTNNKITYNIRVSNLPKTVTYVALCHN